MDLDLWIKLTRTLASFQTLSLKQCHASAVKALRKFNTASNGAETDWEHFKDLFKSEVE